MPHARALLVAATCLVVALSGTQAEGKSQDSPDRPPTTITLPVTWQVGETHRLEWIKEREEYRGGNRVSSARGRTPVDVAVLREAAGDHVIRWTFGRAEVHGDKIPDEVVRSDRLAQEFLGFADGARTEFRVDASGVVLGIENKDEVSIRSFCTIEIGALFASKKHLSAAAQQGIQDFI